MFEAVEEVEPFAVAPDAGGIEPGVAEAALVPEMLPGLGCHAIIVDLGLEEASIFSVGVEDMNPQL